MIDSHVHLDDPRFDADRDAVIARARDAGIDHMIVPGVSPSRWPTLAALRDRYPFISVAIGLHPYSLIDQTPDQIGKDIFAISEVAARERVCAIGECGLDTRIADKGVPLDRQAEILRAHLEIADSLALPLIVHIVGAHGKALEILKERPLPRGGVIHSYSGPADLVPAYVALGYSISFSGSITRPNAKKARAAAAAVPIHSLLVETDAPDQHPSGGSERNEPAHLPKVIEGVADARKADAESIAETTVVNARRLFGFA